MAPPSAAQWPPKLLQQMSLLSPFLEKSIDGNDAGKVSFVAKLCLASLVVISLVELKLFLTPDEYTPLLQKAGHVHGASGFAIFVVVLIFLYLWGLTAGLKVSFIFAMFCFITSLSVWFKDSDFHYWYVLILDCCMVLQSDKDERLLHRVSILLRVMGTVFVAVHVLAQSGLGPQIHPPDEYKYSPVQHFLVGVGPALLNFSLVRSYALSVRKQADRVNHAVDVASQVATLLVNFDLDAAEKLMKQGDRESPVHEPLSKLLQNLRSYRAFLPNSLFVQAEDVREPPNEVLAEAMYDETSSWSRAQSAVRRLRDPDYCLKAFHSDVEAAFPELKLYSVDDRRNTHGTVQTSGRTGFEEYQRTMGAFYSVYCLARVDIDGKEIFSYGVDERWRPLSAPCGEGSEKRRTFYESMEWEQMVQLLIRADLLRVDNVGAMGRGDASARAHRDTWESEVTAESGVSGSIPMAHVFSTKSTRSSRSGSSKLSRTTRRNLVVNVDRMTAFLVLTAVHDVMKNPNLLPVVQTRHAPYKGYSEGSVITDHDTALAYVMEHFAMLLPSYHRLEPGQRAPILFTQGKMGFNNGWLVQGEAPPGALFSEFKRVIVLGRASPADISFYFAHWLTDLAGADPYGSQPWPGSEKFATHFPLKVLLAFLESFAFLDCLAHKSEVEVMEEYLENRWMNLGLQMLPVTSGCKLAAMRLALMAQGFETEAVTALQALPQAELDVIAAEMARTGLWQQFRLAPDHLRESPAGPALLVYYAPALVQKAKSAQVYNALRVLAAVYRAARLLFPLEDGAGVERTVIIRIDALKILAPPDISLVGPWHLRRNSDSDAEAVRGRVPTEPTGQNCERRQRGHGLRAASLELPELDPENGRPFVSVATV